MRESMRALPYMREAHAKTPPRKDGQRYEIRPLSMACYALSLRVLGGEMSCITDATIATILLHDVPEELQIPVEK